MEMTFAHINYPDNRVDTITWRRKTSADSDFRMVVTFYPFTTNPIKLFLAEGLESKFEHVFHNGTSHII